MRKEFLSNAPNCRIRLDDPMDRSGDRGDCIYPAVFADEGAEPKELYGNHSWRRGRCLLEWRRIRQMGVGVLYAAGDLRLQRLEVLSIHWNRLAVAHGLGHPSSPVRKSPSSVQCHI